MLLWHLATLPLQCRFCAAIFDSSDMLFILLLKYPFSGILLLYFCLPVEVSSFWFTLEISSLEFSLVLIFYIVHILDTIHILNYSRCFPVCTVRDVSRSVISHSRFTFNWLILNHESYHNICRSPLNLRFMTGTIRSPEFRPITQLRDLPDLVGHKFVE